MSTIFHLKAEMSGDTPDFEVDADQRDFARFEREPFGVPFHQMMERPYTTLRYLAWTAGRRERKHNLASFNGFEDACILVSRVDDEEESAAEDPGRPAVSAGS